MKVDKQIPITSALDTRAQARPQVATGRASRQPVQEPSAREAREPRGGSSHNGFNFQLNQQLSSMQAADRYLGDLSEQLSALKLSISRQLSAPQSANERETITQQLTQANNLLAERSKRTGQSLDANFKLRLNEPLRSRFSIQGLETLDTIQRAGKETLLFTAGRALAEPVALVLDEGMSEEQILRRLNSSFGNAGIRAELDQDGALTFSMPENDWQLFKEQLRIKGEGKLFPAQSQGIATTAEEGFLELSTTLAQESFRELRQLLDSVVSALDRISSLRQHISLRQEDVREFLAQQESQDEKQWALNFAGAVFDTQGRKASRYSVVAQTVIAQAQLTRFAVVSLLS